MNYFKLWRFDLGEGIRKIVQEQNDERAEEARLIQRIERIKTCREILLFVVFAIISLGMIFHRNRMDALTDRVTSALIGTTTTPHSNGDGTAKDAINGAREESRRRDSSLDEIEKDIGSKQE